MSDTAGSHLFEAQHPNLAHTHTHPVFVRNVSITQPPEKHGQGYSMCSQAFGALLRDWRDRGTSIQLKVKTMRLFV